MLSLCHPLRPTLSVPPKAVRTLNHPSLLPPKAKVRASLESPEAHTDGSTGQGEASIHLLFWVQDLAPPPTEPAHGAENELLLYHPCHTRDTPQAPAPPTGLVRNHAPCHQMPDPKPPRLSGESASVRKPTRRQASTFGPHGQSEIPSFVFLFFG